LPLYIILLPESTGLTETIDGIVYRPPIVDSAGHLKVDVLTSGLPTDAATETTLAELLAALDVALSSRAAESGGNLEAIATALDVALSSIAAESGGNLEAVATSTALLETLLNALASVHTDQLRVDVVTPFTPTSVGSGQATVADAGTRAQLTAQACKAVSIAANPDNTGNIFLGDVTVSSANGRILAPGDAVDLAIDNLNRLYIDAAVDGEGISYLWVA
jgi:hypothetical protein